MLISYSSSASGHAAPSCPEEFPPAQNRVRKFFSALHGLMLFFIPVPHLPIPHPLPGRIPGRSKPRP